jgi:structure-specific recognition protein 1
LDVEEFNFSCNTVCRSFDFEVETKSGVVHTFSSIEKDEYGKLFDFITSKKLRVKNRGKSVS